MFLQNINTRLLGISSKIREYVFSEKYSKITVTLTLTVMILAFLYGMSTQSDSGEKILNGFALSLGTVAILFFVVYALSFEILSMVITLVFWPTGAFFDGLPLLQDALYAVGSLALIFIAIRIPHHMTTSAAR